MPTFAQASDQPFVVRGKTEQNRILVPVRAVSAGLGVEVDWNQKSKTISLQNGETRIVLTVDSAKAVSDGREIALDVPARADKGVTYVPMRFVSQALGGTIAWNQASRFADVSLGEKKARITTETTNNRSEIPQRTVEALAAKANEAADLASYKQIRAHFSLYFSNEYINKLIRDKGLKVRHSFTGDIYSNSDERTGTIAQIGSPNDAGGMFVERTLHVKYADGAWKVYDISFAYLTP